MTWKSDEQLDQAIADYLGWRMSRIDGAPDARTVATRIVDARLDRRSAWQRTTLLVLAALLGVVIVGGVLIVGRGQDTIRPLVNGPILVVNALGWRGVEPMSGADAVLEPCAGHCHDAVMVSRSADGRSVYLVDTSPTDGDLRSTQPGWSIWRWVRGSETATRVLGCEADCRVSSPAESPDGRYLAYLLDDSIAVVADATSGREVRRVERTFLGVRPTWNADGDLIVPIDDGSTARLIRFDVETGHSVDAGLPIPLPELLGSPDGAHMALIEVPRYYLNPLGDRETTTVFSTADPQLGHVRHLATIETPLGFFSPTWAPDGTAIAFIVRSTVPGSSDPATELVVIDATTGNVKHRFGGIVQGDVLWLPAD
jgi:dipeptidyl aminopeptidase/acylaminoacyl peptidase